MAIQTGNYTLSAVLTSTPTSAQPAFGNRTVPTVDGVWEAAPARHITAEHLARHALVERKQLNVGVKSDMFGFLDFYNHIHVQYSLLQLGNIASNQLIAFTIFNAFFVPHTLNDITSINDDGLILTQPAATPLVYPELSLQTYTLSVTPDGPPALDAVYTFSFDLRDYTMEVTGLRVVMFNWIPESPVTEELSWLTDIIPSYDDTEQRICLRVRPRQKIQMSVIFEDEEQDMLMRGVLFDWLPRIWGVPTWWEARCPSSSIEAGTNVIAVDTRFGDFRLGSLVALVEDDSFEVFNINTFDDTSITLTSLTINAYTQFASVVPVRTAVANTQPSISRRAINVETVNMQFTTLDNIDLADTTGQSMYAGKVLLDDPNLMGSAQLSEQFERPVTIIDNGTGTITQTSAIDRSRIRSTKGWLISGLQELWRVRRLVHSFRGSQQAFFIPPFRQDLIVTRDIGANATTFFIKNVQYTQYIKSRRPLADVRLTFVDGTTSVRQITGSSLSGAEEILTVDTLWSTSSIPTSSIIRAELVMLMRISDDKVTFTHNAAYQSKAIVNLVSVKE